MHPGNARLPRSKCALCQGEVIWVERVDGKRISIDPGAVTGVDGEFERVNSDPTRGPINQVRRVPEDQRWMRERLYVAHYRTCLGFARCKRVGVHDFAGCRTYLESSPMTQSAREERQPEAYRLDRSQ